MNLFWQIVLREIIVDILDFFFYNCLLGPGVSWNPFYVICIVMHSFVWSLINSLTSIVEPCQHGEELLEFFCFIFFLSSNVWGLATNVCVTYHFICRYLLLTTYLVYTFILRVIDWWCSFGILTSYYSIWCNVQACIYMYVAYLTW